MVFRRVGLILITALLMIGAFQNCSKTGGPSAANPGGSIANSPQGPSGNMEDGGHGEGYEGPGLFPGTVDSGYGSGESILGKEGERYFTLRIFKGTLDRPIRGMPAGAQVDVIELSETIGDQIITDWDLVTYDINIRVQKVTFNSLRTWIHIEAPLTAVNSGPVEALMTLTEGQDVSEHHVTLDIDIGSLCETCQQGWGR